MNLQRMFSNLSCTLGQCPPQPCQQSPLNDCEWQWCNSLPPRSMYKAWYMAQLQIVCVSPPMWRRRRADISTERTLLKLWKPLSMCSTCDIISYWSVSSGLPLPGLNLQATTWQRAGVRGSSHWGYSDGGMWSDITKLGLLNLSESHWGKKKQNCPNLGRVFDLVKQEAAFWLCSHCVGISGYSLRVSQSSLRV